MRPLPCSTIPFPITMIPNPNQIRYATRHNIPFLAVSTGHGQSASLSKVQDGIMINMRGLNAISISDDATYATVGGGIKGKEVIDHLWAHGKQTVTGVCECVSLSGVALGGGHGILQGHHGLLSDQILSLRLVLANGSAITVSETENTELFWALRGAGHNFGVVTELKYRIYGIDQYPGGETWSYEALTYPATRENVRAVYSIAKGQMDTQLEGMMIYGMVTLNPQVSNEPILMHHVALNGPLANLSAWTKPYHDLAPAAVAKEEGTFLDLPRFFQIEDRGPACNAAAHLPGTGKVRVPVDIPTYNVDALVAAVDKFVQVRTSNPEFAGSFMVIEQYSTKGVRSIDPAVSVFPSRQDKLLLAPEIFYPSLDAETGEQNRALHELAVQSGEEIKRLLVQGAKEQGGGSHSYVNYAYGGETLEEVYGKEGLGRLRKLKREFDPRNRFGYYVPVEPAEETEGHDEL